MNSFIKWTPISSPFMPGAYRKIDTDGSKIRELIDAKITMMNNHVEFFERKQQFGIEGEVESDKKVEQSVLKSYDPLSKLAYNILKVSSDDHQVVIKRSSNEVIRTEKNTKQKTIYRFLSNEELGVQPPQLKQEKPTPIPVKNPKLGRPKKRVHETGGVTCLEIPIKVKMQDDFANVQTCVKETPLDIKPISKCSRFGRVLKPVHPLPIIPQNFDEKRMGNLEEETRELIRDLKDKDFLCRLELKQTESSMSNTLPKTEIEAPVPIASSSPTKRNVPPESICPTCKKIFLGRRLKRHFVDHPDHMKSETPNLGNQLSNPLNDDVSLFRFLVSKLQKSNLNEDQRADLFLHELNDLVEQLQLRSSRLIRNTSGLHFVNARVHRVLQIPEGHYALDMTAIDAPPEPENSCTMNIEINALPVPSNNTRSLDYTALSLDDTLTDEAAQKLNLSAGGKLLPPSEESLLRAVDDLVPPTGITKLVVSNNLINQPVSVNNTTSSSSTVDTIVPNYDHASDNAVEAVTMKECNASGQAQPLLDLAVDFSQFNSNK